MNEATVGIAVGDDLLDALAERLQARVETRRWYTTEQLAEHFGRSPRWVRGLGERGCPYARVGRSSIWDIHEVDSFLEGRMKARRAIR
jgi:hypothetical protein